MQRLQVPHFSLGHAVLRDGSLAQRDLHWAGRCRLRRLAAVSLGHAVFACWRVGDCRRAHLAALYLAALRRSIPNQRRTSAHASCPQHVSDLDTQSASSRHGRQLSQGRGAAVWPNFWRDILHSSRPPISLAEAGRRHTAVFCPTWTSGSLVQVMAEICFRVGPSCGSLGS